MDEQQQGGPGTVTSGDTASGMEIAVIGLAGRFPGARDVDELWRNLRSGVESIRRYTPEELEALGVDAELIRNPDYVPCHAAMDDVEMFDAAFFGLSPREAEVLNPQSRWFLEVSWEALEKAGYDPDRYPGPIGVFAGSHANFYLHRNVQRNQRVMKSVGEFQAVLANLPDGLAQRVSYKLNLRGTSVAVHCACSTSLVAIHLGCQSLLAGECDMALAGGATVIVPQGRCYLYHEGMIFSPDGHCRTFDARAKGTVPGDAVAVVVLKRLADAVADGDHIHAVILGSASNNDGSDKIGYTAPGLVGQRRAVIEAQHVAGVHPDSITYVEAHGTATALGDPIEVAALSQAFRLRTQRTGYCAIGSVKSNFGHVDAAAGVTAFIKTVLALEQREIPPTLHYERSNPEIDFAASPFYVATRLEPWTVPDGGPRRAGVSSFGIGGTNAHAVLEEAPPTVSEPSRRDRHLLLLSARSEAALTVATERLRDHLAAGSNAEIADVAWTLAVGRRAFAYRRMVVAADAKEAVALLAGHDSRRRASGTAPKDPVPVVFMFPGQGAQYPDMGLGLYRSEPGFRAEVDRCCELLEPHLGYDLRRVLFPPPSDAAGAGERLKQTAVAQPALFVSHWALASLWREWGVEPVAMIGHSIGEYAAACLAGVLSLEDALKLVVARGRLMQSLPGGDMLVVPLPEAEVQPLLEPEVAVAAVNAPQMSVVSGPAPAVARLQALLAARGLQGQILETSHAFHSPMMEPILEPFAELLAGVRLSPPERPFVSTVTGDWIRPEEATSPAHWLANIRRPVRFAAGAGLLLAARNQAFLEVGPGTTLGSLLRLHPAKSADHTVVASLRHPLEAESDEAVALAALGRLWVAGAAVDPARTYAGERRQRVTLPAYPFERRRYWVEPRDHQDQRVATRNRRGASSLSAEDWFWRPGWRSTAMPPVLLAPANGGPRRPCLIFADASGLGERLARLLRRRGHAVATVVPGAAFARSGPDTWSIDPRSGADYAALVAALDEARLAPSFIAHLWSADPPHNARLDAAMAERAQDLGLYSLLHLARALGDRGLPEPVRLRAVSASMQEVFGGETRAPERATLIGACRVIPQELPNLACASVDVERAGDANDERLTLQLASELLSTTDDPVVAFRGWHRWVEEFEPVVLSLDGGATAPSRRVRPGGVYLITGGLGGVGLAFAEHLAVSAGARLILTARSPLPAPADWDKWLAEHGDGDATARRIGSVRRLEQMGSEVLAAGVDVTDEAAMTALVAEGRRRFGALHGVIHAAGVVGDNPIKTFTRESVQRVLAPKMRGALALERSVAGEQLDFFLLMSSLSSLLGGLGQADYCAANSFLDAFARARDGGNLGRVTATNWDAWDEVGMAARYAEEKGSENRTNWLSPRDGCEALDRVLAHDLVQVIITKNDFRQVRSTFASLIGSLKPRSEEQDGEPVAAASREGLSSEYVAPAGPVEEAIARLWSDLLAIAQVGGDDDFFELGGHSLLATQVVARLKERFGIELLLREVLEAPTVRGLAALVERKRWVGAVADASVGDEGNVEEIEV